MWLNIFGKISFQIKTESYLKNKVKKIVNFACQNSLIPPINKPTRVSGTNATAIDHMLTNALLNKQIETGIMKTDIWIIFLYLLL